ncbi:MAG: BatA domain-containing protein [Bacteroidia bacterium]
MQFVYPQFLWALSLLTIPVIIHLFNFRRYKKILFSNTAMVTAATAVNKKQQNIKKWLVLLCRLLFMALLVIAFAQPYKASNNVNAKYAEKIVAVYIDNSFSMLNTGETGELLETAKNKARQLADLQNPATNFMLLTNDFEGKHQHIISKELFNQFIDEVKISSNTKTLSEVLSRQQQLLKQYINTQKSSYIISDFQTGFNNAKTTDFDSAVKYYFIPLKANINNNISIDTAFVITPFFQTQKPIIIEAKIKNFGSGKIENLPVLLKVNGIQKALQNISIEPNKHESIQFNIVLNDTNTQQIEVSLTDFPITFDDSYFLTLKPSSSVNVLLINGSGNTLPIKKVYQVDDFYQLSVQEITNINYTTFGKASLIILHEPTNLSSGLAGELQKYVEQGGTLFVISGKNEISLINFLTNLCRVTMGSPLNTKLSVAEINTKETLLSDVFSSIPKDADMPVFNVTLPLNKSTSSKTTNILTLNNGHALLTKSSVKKGNVFVLGTSLVDDFGNFHKHALFVPIMLKMPLLTSNKTINNYSINNTNQILVNADIKEPVIEIKNNETSIMANLQLRNSVWYANTNNSITKAGFYDLVSSNKTIDKIAVNYLRTESNIIFETPKTINNNIENIGENIEIHNNKLTKAEKGSNYWFLALVLSVVFLILELLILRFMK